MFMNVFFQAVSADLIVLGCVSEITPSGVTISLPGSIFAVAPKSFITPYRVSPSNSDNLNLLVMGQLCQ